MLRLGCGVQFGFRSKPELQLNLCVNLLLNHKNNNKKKTSIPVGQ